MLTAADIESMADTAALALPDECTILRPIRVSDGEGGWIMTWGTVALDVPCRLDPSGFSDVEAARADQQAVTTRASITLPAGQDITEPDHLVIDGEWQVSNIHPFGAWEITRDVDAVRA